MKFDFSIIPSYECNLKCWFCMYECSPTNLKALNYESTKKFTETIDWNKVSSFGFYGGEISINLLMYQQFINLIPENIPKFTITNGAWSTDNDQTYKFIDFVYKNKLRVKISSTPEHRAYQNIEVLRSIEKFSEGDLYIKLNDDTQSKLLSMGRLSHIPFECTRKCKNLSMPMNGNEKVCRMALEPSGDIILQSCDGRYPVVGSYKSTFDQIMKRYDKFNCPYDLSE